MKSHLLSWLISALALAGCSAQKAPGWPIGDERPINVQKQGGGGR